MFILLNNEFLELLQKELESINVNLEMNQEMLNEGINKLNLIYGVIKGLVCLNDENFEEYLNIKQEEYPIFKKFLDNIKKHIEILEELRNFKEREINFTKKYLKL